VFSDDFNGSAVDETVWDLWERDYFGPQVRSAVAVGGGNLTITTYTDPADGLTKSGSLSTGWTGSDWPQASDGFRAAYGYIEARIKVGDKAPAGDPHKVGTNNSFWLMSDNGNSSMPFGDVAADGPEIDIMEHGNGPNSVGDFDSDGKCDWNGEMNALGVPCNEILSDGAHWDGFDEDHKSFHETPVKNPTATPLANNFHEYGLLWTPNEYRFYVDGKETSRSAVGMAFNPAHMILSTGPGEGNYGPLGDSANDHMVVDYVKVWQRPVSDVPDQSTPVNTPLTVPFTVQDYTFNDPTKPDPGTVVVSAASSNTTLVPTTGVAVAGNGPSDPDGAGPLEATDGSFANGDLESTSSWTLTGGANATISSTKHYTGSNSLKLLAGGGKATQTITNLRPNTTYVIDANYELDLEYTDTNSNGRVDAGETFTDVNDTRAKLKWGVQDVDSALAGDQTVATMVTRDGAGEQAKAAWWKREPWQQEMMKFTTGPTTTSVTFFADNTPFVGNADDSNGYFDSVVIRPLVPANRAVTIRPADGKVGTSTITLTAKNAAGTTIDSDTFVVTVGAGNLRDGAFEAGATTTPWTLLAGTKVTVADVFKQDRQLVFATVSADTATQTITGLTANTRYKLDFTGRTTSGSSGIAASVGNYNGSSSVSTTITSATSTTQSVEFVTDASHTSADLVLLDWNPGDGKSWAEKVNLSKCTTTGSCAALVTDFGAAPAPPALSTNPQSTVSGTPIAIPVALPSGATLTGVTSTNEVLVPNPNVSVITSGTNSLHKVITASSLPDRTGLTKLRVAYTGAAGSPVDIPLTVSDANMLQPGFEKGTVGWALTGTASVITTGQRSGTGALQINGAGDATQVVAGLPHGTEYEIGGWVNGTVTVTLKTVPVDPNGTEQEETLATATWTGGGGGFTENKTAFQTLLFSDSGYENWRPVKVVISNTAGQNGKIDDLYLVHRPVIRRIRDLSLHSGHTVPDWNTHRDVVWGRAAENAMWDTSAFTFTSTDIAGFGTGVVPVSSLSPLEAFDQAWPFQSMLKAKAAGGKTGRSLITVKLTDPATGNFTTRTYNITVNAGTNFSNGDFERSSLGGANTQWQGSWLNDSNSVTAKQAWRYLGEHNSGWTYVGPRDDNKVLRISSGAVRFDAGKDGTGADLPDLITGLTPSTTYKVKFRAKGSGSTVSVKATNDIVFGTVLGSRAITPPDSTNVWRDYEFTFTTNASGDGSTSVALFVVDADTSGGAVAPSSRPCAQFATGESCLDDLGVFKSTDVP
jgi:hypothetical protein